MKRRMGVGRIRVTLIPHAEDSLIKVNPNDEMASMIMSTAVRASEAHFKTPFHRLWGIVHCEKRPFSHTFPLKTRERVRERTETRSDTQLECSRTALKPLQVHRSQSHCQDTFSLRRERKPTPCFNTWTGRGGDDCEEVQGRGQRQEGQGVARVRQLPHLCLPLEVPPQSLGFQEPP